MRLIDADTLINGRVENDPVRIAAECAPTVHINYMTTHNPYIPNRFSNIISEYYEAAEREGRLYILPCKPKQIVYIIDHSFSRIKEKPFKCEVDEFLIDGFGCYAVLNGCENFYMMRRFKATNIKNFGETVFLTEAEAAAALQAMKEDKQ